MEELTQDHLNQGIERLARVLYDEFYVINSDKNRLVLIHDIKKQQITERRISLDKIFVYLLLQSIIVY